MADSLFSEDLAFSIAKFSSFEKGKEYFRDGLVEKIWDDGSIYHALVKGNEVYHVNLKFENEEIEYDCTCPFDFGGACKHVVAAILTFASDKKYAKPSSNDTARKDEVITKLLKEAAPAELISFLEKILKKEPELIKDLKIFLAGPKETPVTVSEYKDCFIKELNKLDMRELLEMWYREGDDYYDSDSHYGDFSEGDSLSETVSGFISDGQKYEENNNIAEAMKIYQAIFEALDKKQDELRGDVADLSDAFEKSKGDVVDRYLSVLSKTENKDLRNIAISYLGLLFLKHSIFEDQIMNCLQNIKIDKKEAEKLLDILSKAEKNDLSSAASTLLAFLYQITEDWQKYETLSLGNLRKNPGLGLDLLKYYQKTNRKDEIIKVANAILSSLPKKDSYDYMYTDSGLSNKDIEIMIRQFIKNIYSPDTEYPAFMDNLEWIFLLTGSLKDYQELVKTYRETEEKEKFWHKMKTYFEKDHKIQDIFKIFKFENKKEDILNLLKNYHDTECFPEMVSFVRVDFPSACFLEYKKKIEELLKETDVRKYSEAVYHLKRMQKIGLEKEFNDYVNQMKTTFWRRRRLMEELRENQL